MIYVVFDERWMIKAGACKSGGDCGMLMSGKLNEMIIAIGHKKPPQMSPAGVLFSIIKVFEIVDPDQEQLQLYTPMALKPWKEY